MTPQLPPSLARVARANPVHAVDDERGQTADAQTKLAQILADDPSAPKRRAPRRGRRVLIGAVAALLLAVGAALAATDPFGIFRNPNPGSALYGVDSTRHVKPPTAFLIRCPRTAGNSFACGAGLAGVRYQLLDHVESNGAGRLNRHTMETAIRQARARGQISAAMATRFDRDLAAVSDGFLAKLQTMFRYGTLSAGLTRVPPRGVPALIVCEPAGRALSCQDLNGDANAAVGSGIYEALPAPDWRPAPPQRPDNSWALVVSILGHQPTQAELRVFFDMAMTATSSTRATSGQARRAPPPPKSP
jgi:hypothetical protein